MIYLELNSIIKEKKEAVLEANSDLGIIRLEEKEENIPLNEESLLCQENDIPGDKNLILHRFPYNLKVMLLEEEKDKIDDGLIVNCLFPALRDPGTSWSFLEKRSKKKSVCGDEETYIEICKCLEVAPITFFFESLTCNEVDLGFYGVSSKAVQAMANSIRRNIFIKVLSLEENHLTNVAVHHLVEMLRVNVTLSELNLRGCKIGQKGAEILASGIQANTSLKLLNLANNCIEDDGMKFLYKSFLEHFALKKIILSGNNLFKKSGFRLGRMLEENCILEELDLSWNRLNSKEGCKKLFTGLKINTSLKYFDISWNGLDELAAGPLAECLSKNNILQYLDISNNSFTDVDVLVIGEALKKNTSLKQLKMLKQVLKVRKVQVLYGGYKSDYQVKGPDVKELLLKRAKFLAQQPKKHPKDFGQFILKLEDEPLKGEEFQFKLNEAKIKLDKDLVTEILEAFKINKVLNTKVMKDYYLKLFPDTKLIIKAKNVKKKGKRVRKLGKTGAKLTKK